MFVNSDENYDTDFFDNKIKILTPLMSLGFKPEGNNYYCSLDGAEFSVCLSPYSLKDLTKGLHILQIKDSMGNIKNLQIDFGTPWGAEGEMKDN